MKTKLFKKVIRNSSKKRLSKTSTKECFEVLSYLINHKNTWISGSWIEAQLGYKYTQKQLRRIIQKIREHNHEFFNPSNTYFIVANVNGYNLTNDPNEKEKYFKAMSKRAESLEKQIAEMEITNEKNH